MCSGWESFRRRTWEGFAGNWAMGVGLSLVSLDGGNGLAGRDVLVFPGPTFNDLLIHVRGLSFSFVFVLSNVNRSCLNFLRRC